MGRELKRVAMNFQWPENKAWEGFLNPHYAKRHDCEACDGTGYSPRARLLSDLWYGKVPFQPEDRGSTPFLPTHPAVRAYAERNMKNLPEYLIECEARRLADLFNGSWSHHLNADDVAALLEGGRLKDLTHTWTREAGWVPKQPPHTPSPEEVNVWSISGGFAHDACNQWVVARAECKRLGVDAKCAHCAGSGEIWDSPEDEQAADEWTKTEPPAGDGYQIWETVSEGSPISPVFATPEELAQHLAGKPWGADKGSSYEDWMRFINGPGWAVSIVMDSTGIRSGPSAAF